jgi:hypothetical protein
MRLGRHTAREHLSQLATYNPKALLQINRPRSISSHRRASLLPSTPPHHVSSSSAAYYAATAGRAGRTYARRVSAGERFIPAGQRSVPSLVRDFDLVLVLTTRLLLLPLLRSS